MSETQQPYEMKTPDLGMVVNDTCTVTLLHKAMIADLVARGICKSRSEAYRKGIELLYSSLQPSQATLPQKDNGHES